MATATTPPSVSTDSKPGALPTDATTTGNLSAIGSGNVPYIGVRKQS